MGTLIDTSVIGEKQQLKENDRRVKNKKVVVQHTEKRSGGKIQYDEI